MTLQQAPLSEVLSRCGRGNQDDFATLYDATSARIHCLVLRIIDDPAQADEITRDVFLNIWRSSPSFDPVTESALTWLLTLTYRTSVDHAHRADRP